MIDQEETEVKGEFHDAFDRAWDKNAEAMGSSEAVNVDEVPSINPQLPIAEEGANSQDVGSGDNPDASVDSMTVLEAIAETKRVGLPPESLKGKSEAEIISMGQEASTIRRQSDRDHLERQKREREASAQPASDSTPETTTAPDGDGVGSDDGTTEGGVDYTAVVEELGEEAARPIIEALQKGASENEALRKQLEQRESERQLAPLRKQADAVMDGLAQTRPDLSKPESRAKLEQMATEITRINADKYAAMKVEDRIEAALSDAASLIYGGETSTKRRVAEAPGSNSNAVPLPDPTTKREMFDAGFDRAWSANMGRRS